MGRLFVIETRLFGQLRDALSQRIAVVRFVGDHPQRFLSWTARLMTPSYPDRRERRFREPDFRRGCRVKVVSQRKTAAVEHHHPLRPLAPLGAPEHRALHLILPLMRASDTALRLPVTYPHVPIWITSGWPTICPEPWSSFPRSSFLESFRFGDPPPE